MVAAVQRALSILAPTVNGEDAWEAIGENRAQEVSERLTKRVVFIDAVDTVVGKYGTPTEDLSGLNIPLTGKVEVVAATATPPVEIQVDGQTAKFRGFWFQSRELAGRIRNVPWQD